MTRPRRPGPGTPPTDPASVAERKAAWLADRLNGTQTFASVLRRQMAGDQPELTDPDPDAVEVRPKEDYL